MTMSSTSHPQAAEPRRASAEELEAARARQVVIRAEVTDIQRQLSAKNAEAAGLREGTPEYEQYQTWRTAAVRALEDRKKELADLRQWLTKYGEQRTISPDIARGMLALVQRISREARVPLTDDERATLKIFTQLTRE